MLDKSQRSKPMDSDNMSADEIARFDAMAQEWWDPDGKFKTALAFNKARLDVMLRQLCLHFDREQGADCLRGIRILDVGCGGGLVSETLAGYGADVTGVDASAVSIEVARRHARQSNIDVHYRHGLSADIAREGMQFDGVINAEVVEHVPDQPALINECAGMVKPGGMLILATLNRTLKSFIVAIVGAEYVMRYLPVGTHDWRKFVTPGELQQWSGKEFVKQFETGMRLNPFSGKWHTCHSTAVNYLQCYAKQS
ncbi:bifunctional 2-polyprenyl-6-hydroxyphenol methylase/3-demethylubiquinol 3-O-methyltransferase UbiG [Alteromonas halophila]|uniref:Ubiquinone biosynthesis O-methyltransferase n=1 Tax=Alteromonas halophila TaxID=516698 RepID=A0A918JJ34_9ALTE|nr:bifunctional 2-polyprenyl-6-hydroxyphenol methylase/3-demethylubiquinol 3-O-methyltransferase UbiG [Alteromonas halophila]GGW83490.1 ubiquinone biosynthesis O-methyltransferase [Alteromonas halophila]